VLRAGIDIGTNTILLLIADIVDGRVAKIVEDHVCVVRLGEGVDKNRTFSSLAMQRAKDCFENYANILKRYPGIPVQAVATSGSRDANNSVDFFETITRQTGIPISVISGPQEATLSFLGSKPDGVDPATLAVLDIGGGSTEIVGQEPSEQLFRVSFDIGCVRLTERFFSNDPPLESEITELQKFLDQTLIQEKALLEKLKNKNLIGVAGTPTYLSSILLGLQKFDPALIHDSVISLSALKKLRQDLSLLAVAQKLGMGGMDKGRADVIVAGALILESILTMANLDKIKVSVRGLRYGVVLTDW
jgi:exopolyphosphatase / guanosine-5'-triphosphate,3'-diphosphate pyrophosphatase